MYPQVKALTDITKKDVLDFFRELIATGASKRRKLACHVVSMAKDGAGNAVESEKKVEDEANGLKAEVVTDPIEFRNGLGLYPIAQPFIKPELLLRRRKAESDSV